jgi:hypothetical protein
MPACQHGALPALSDVTDRASSPPGATAHAYPASTWHPRIVSWPSLPDGPGQVRQASARTGSGVGLPVVAGVTNPHGRQH